jgi:hypothetical protein
MKKTLLAVAVGLVASTSAFASNMYIDLGSNAFDPGTVGTCPLCIVYSTGDANSTTGSFNEFGFSQILATSVYDLFMTRTKHPNLIMLAPPEPMLPWQMCSVVV